MNATPIALAERAPRYEPAGVRRQLGLIVLATDLTSERDFARLIPRDRAAVYTTRVAFQNPTTPDNLRQMAPRLGAAAELILPGEPLAALCYSCTSASVVIGDQAVARAIHAVRPGVPVVTPSGAALLAFVALGVRRIAVVTPYLVETSRPMAEYFIRHGLQITRFECFGLDDDRAMARVCQDDIIAAACRVDSVDAEAVFLSCTGLPAVDTIAAIEKRIGKPVVTSNQASAWAMRHHAELDSRPEDATRFGRLFRRPLAAGEPTTA